MDRPALSQPQGKLLGPEIRNERGRAREHYPIKVGLGVNSVRLTRKALMKDSLDLTLSVGRRLGMQMSRSEHTRTKRESVDH